MPKGTTPAHQKKIKAAVETAALNFSKQTQEEDRAFGAAKRAAESAHDRMLMAVRSQNRDIERACDQYVEAAERLADAVRAYAGKRT
jgi:hypothetical protein